MRNILEKVARLAWAQSFFSDDFPTFGPGDRFGQGPCSGPEALMPLRSEGPVLRLKSELHHAEGSIYFQHAEGRLESGVSLIEETRCVSLRRDFCSVKSKGSVNLDFLQFHDLFLVQESCRVVVSLKGCLLPRFCPFSDELHL